MFYILHHDDLENQTIIVNEINLIKLLLYFLRLYIFIYSILISCTCKYL